MKIHRVIILMLMVLLFFIGSINASEDIGFNQTADTLSVDFNQSSLESNFGDTIVGETSDEVTVNDWEELQYYCSLNDKDYVLKLKEHTNYYPSDVSDSNGQILVKNNVKIIGSEGAYIGDSSPQAGEIGYTAIKVADDSGIGITLENITFKWIATNYQPDGVFLVMGGNANNSIINCYFTNISTNMGHSSILHIKKGSAVLTNCTFVNCTTDYGCLSVYNPNDDPTQLCTLASMEVNDCYFEGNYAKTEPGCINNCGILVVNNSTFYKNSAFWWAGAIHTHGGANTTIYDSDFIDNLAGWNGGALYTYSYLQIYNSRFIGNNCTTNNGGGAIGACKYLHAPYIHIEDSLFQNNENLCWGLDDLSTSGTGRGGAISLMDEGGLELYNNIFIENSASIGSAICAISGGLSYGSPDVKIVGNQFINHTRAGDVLDVRLATGSIAEIRDNYFLNNSMVFEKLKLSAEDPVNGLVTFHLDASLKNPNYYDDDILDKSSYYVYVNGQYHSTVSGPDFTLDLGKGNTAHVYVVPSISNSNSNEVFAGIAKTFIYVSQSQGNDNNSGLSRSQPVKTLNKSIELARSHENIVIMDGTFAETDLIIDYNLTITAENGAAITVNGNAFTITDGDVNFVNVSFKNSKYGSSTKNRLILQNGTGFLRFERCVFQANEYKVHIEASGAIEGENLIVTGNKDGSFIKCDSIKLKSSVFTNNIATYTLYKSLIIYSSQTVKLECENLTFIGNTVDSGCIDLKKGSGTVTDSTFIANKVKSGRGSAILLEDGSSLIVQSSKFINNTDTGKYSSVIYITSGNLVIKDSILINNTYENTNNLVINGAETYLKKLIANNNWWGNTPDDLSKPALKVYPASNQLPNGWDPASYWLVLNATSLSNDIGLNKKVPVQFIFTQIDNFANVSSYDSYYLPSFDLELTAVNGTCDDDHIKVENGVANTYFTLTDINGGSLTGSFNGLSVTINFKFSKSSPDMTINVNDTTFGNSAVVEVVLDSSVTGDLIVKVGNITQTAHISDLTTFVIPALPVGNYTVEVNYTGDEIYDSVVNTAKFSVNRIPSYINISCGEIELDKDVVFTFSLSDGATGVIDVYVNNQNRTINVGEIYTISNIARGDYIVKAIYRGDNIYLESSDEFYFEVGKFTPSINVSVPDITYGTDAVVTVTVDNDATGNISVAIDGKVNTTEINNGHAVLAISNLNAGQDKLVTVSYTGDNNYKRSTITKTFNIEKAVLDFTINSNDIKIGWDETVEIILPAYSGGTITLTGIKTEVKNVPLSGIVKVTYTDLENGSYTVFAQYNGDNYQTLSKSTSFTVSLWDEPQWANEGGDIRHTGKSPYDSSANGELKWSSEVANITANLAIDSEGNIYVTAKEGIYSFDNKGNLRWTYLNDNAGDYFAGIAISRDVIISPKADDTLFFINQTTGERYGHANIYLGSSYFAPVVDSNANVYISGQGDANNPNLIIVPYKIWENGGDPIVISLGNAYPSAAPTIIDDTFVVVPCRGAIKIVDISSKEVVYSKSGNINVSSVIGDGNMIYSIFGDSITAFTLTGGNSWTTKVTGGAGNQLAIDNEQGIYAVNAKGTLYRYDLIDGSESKFTNLTVTSGILIGSDGNVYFASDNIFYAFDCDGNILWESKLDLGITGKPVMDDDGIIYINSANKVYALGQSSLKNPDLSIETENIYTNQIETITITLNENATGIVEITINNNKSQETVINGKVVISLDNLIAGDYNVDVNYLGDSRFVLQTKSAQFKVLKSNPNMNVTVKNINVNEYAQFNVDLPANAGGTVTVVVNGITNSSSNIDEGKVNVAISGLTYGNYEYEVSYSGDGLYNQSQKTGVISVGKVKFDFDVQPISDAYLGNPIEFIISNVPSDATGKFIVEVADLSNESIADNGQAIIVVSGLKVNNYTAYVSYVDENRYMADAKSISFSVVKQDIALDVDVSDINVGDAAKFMISVLPNDVTGNITVSVDNIFSSALIDNGQAVISLAGLSDGLKLASVTFSGDDRYNSKTISKEFKVSKIDPSFSINDVGNVYVSDNVVFKAILNPDASGEISVTVNGRNQGQYQIANGTCDIVLMSLAYGNKTVVFNYSGNSKYNSKTISKTFFVDKNKPTFIVGGISNIYVGENATFNIELSSDVTGFVNVTVGGISKQVSAKSNLQISIPILEEGLKTAIFSYSGDSKYLSDSVSVNFSVNRYDLNIVSDVENTNYGNRTKVTVWLYPDDATGTVNVTVDGISHFNTVSGGKAVIEFDNLTVGNKTATISYSGNYKYNPSSISKGFAIINDTHDTPKVNASIDVSVEDINVGDGAVFIINLNSDATGIVTVRVDDISDSASLSSGKAIVSLYNLTGGLKKASIIYEGDNNYLSCIVFKEFNVNKLTPSISVLYDDSIDIGEVMTFTVTLNSDASGKVSIGVDNVIDSAEIFNGVAVINVANLTKGNKTARISYSGDNKYNSLTVTREFSVGMIRPTINVRSDDINVGDTAIFYIELDHDATGIVSLNIDGKFNSSNLIGGTAKITIDGLTSGIKVATINYIGDSKYLSANTSCGISVNKVNAPISVNVGDVDYGLPVNLEVILPDDAKGTVKVISGEKELTESLVNSKASFVIDDLDAGDYAVEVVYLGDGKFKENSTAHNFKVNKADAKFSSVIPEVSYGDVAVITVNFLSGETGEVVVSLAGHDYAATIVNSKAIINITGLSGGNYSVLISYSGDKNHNSVQSNAKLTVNQLDSRFNIENGVQYSVYAVDYKAGERGKTLKFQLFDSNGNAVSGANVKLTYGNTVVNKTTDSQGMISLVVNIQAAGTYKSSLYFSGDEKYNSASASFSIKVNKKPITITAKAKTFKVKVKTKKYTITLKTKKCSSSNGKVYLKSGKKVTLKIKGKTYTAKINAKGQATFKITKFTKKGKFTATIKFNGDNAYKAATKKVKITIK